MPTILKWTVYAILAFAVGLLIAPTIGCTALDLAPAQTFNQRAAYAYANITGAREAATKALQAGTITIDDAEHVQALANRARAIVDAARGIHSLDPKGTSAMDRLILAEGVLAELTAYLSRRKVNP